MSSLPPTSYMMKTRGSPFYRFITIVLPVVFTYIILDTLDANAFTKEIIFKQTLGSPGNIYLSVVSCVVSNGSSTWV